MSHGRRQAEIDGLRAIAIVAVVLFHAEVPGFSGGFVGVDVFFVISGFLITRLLVQEFDRRHTIGLAAFWARRFRRILPTLLLTIVITTALGWMLQPSWEIDGLAASGRAAAASFSNFFFWAQPNGYFDTRVVHQPLLHTWSLGVEEQFYLVWPLLALAALRFGGRRALAAVTAVMVAASLAVSWWLASTSPSAAFYLPHSRMWELGVGALAALAAARLGRLSGVLRSAFGALAIATIGASVAMASSDSGFPAPSALAPVLATAACLLSLPASTTPSRLARVLAARPLATIGVYSYSWYLFHWPAIVLLRVRLGRHHLAAELAMCAATLALAAVNWRVVERPLIQGGRSPRATPRRAIAFGAAAALLVVGSTTAVKAINAEPQPIELADVIEELTQTTLTDQQADTPSSGTQAEFTWQSDDGRSLLAESRSTVVFECVALFFSRPFEPQCEVLPGSPSIVVVGDSHAVGLVTALLPIAQEEGLGLRVVGQAGCPVVGVRVYNGESFDQRCTEWAHNVRRDIAAHATDVAAVVWGARSGFYLPGAPLGGSFRPVDVSVGDHDGPVDADTAAALWHDELRAFIDATTTAGVPFVLVHASPEMPEVPSDCLLTATVNDCSTSRDAMETYRLPMFRAEESAATDLAFTVVVDPLSVLCDATWCPPAMGSAVLYHDTDHLTPAASRLLTPLLRAALQRATAGT